VTPVHGTAARGFTAGAEAYERARPGYPADAVTVIIERLDLRPGRTVLELGAGTGKLTRLLGPSGARILALEPVGAMRSKLLEIVPGVELIDGTAEAIGLPAASVDAVAVAQAFHWFDGDRALLEIHRVLRPEGHLLLAWNRRDESVPWVRAVGDLIRTLAAGEPQVRDNAWRQALDRCALFGPWQSVTFPHAQSLTRDGILDRVASVSYVAAAEPAARAEVLAGVLAVLEDDPATAGREAVDLPYGTEVMWAARRTAEPGSPSAVPRRDARPSGAALPLATPIGGPMAKTQSAGNTAPAQTREALLAQHAEARARRNAAEPGGHEWEQASADVGRIEVQIAALERAMDPPGV
jgi:SAM-dependent methyltransferase